MGVADPASDDTAHGLLQLVVVVDALGQQPVDGLDDRGLDVVEGRVVLREAAGVETCAGAGFAGVRAIDAAAPSASAAIASQRRTGRAAER